VGFAAISWVPQRPFTFYPGEKTRRPLLGSEATQLDLGGTIGLFFGPIMGRFETSSFLAVSSGGIVSYADDSIVGVTLLEVSVMGLELPESSDGEESKLRTLLEITTVAACSAETLLVGFGGIGRGTFETSVGACSLAADVALSSGGGGFFRGFGTGFS